MDSTDGLLRGLETPKPTEGTPESEQTEPWGFVHPKRAPRELRRRLKEYRQRFPEEST